MSNQVTYSQNSNIFSKKINGAWHILEPDQKIIQQLNPTSSFIWQLLKKPISINQIVIKLQQSYSVTQSKALKDTNNLIKRLLKKNLIKKL